MVKKSNFFKVTPIRTKRAVKLSRSKFPRKILSSAFLPCVLRGHKYLQSSCVSAVDACFHCSFGSCYCSEVFWKIEVIPDYIVYIQIFRFYAGPGKNSYK